MKITDLKTWVVGNPPPGFGGRYFIFLKLVTDNGIEGVGEVYCRDLPAARSSCAMIEDVFERHVVGTDPFRIEALWRKVYGRGYSLRPDISLDGRAERASRWPCGTSSARRSTSRSTSCWAAWCTSGCAPTPTSTRRATRPTRSTPTPTSRPQRAAEYVAQGFTAVKFDPAGRYRRLRSAPALARARWSCRETFCRKLREAVGGKADLLFGTHGQFTASGAIRLAQAAGAVRPALVRGAGAAGDAGGDGGGRARHARSRSPPASG